jgi:integrase
MHHGRRYRTPVDAFALVRGARQPVSSKQEAEKVWEPKFIGEIVSGRDPRKPPAPPAAEGMTVADFLEQYYERYVVAESLRSIASIRSRLAALKEGLDTLPVSALERTDTIEDFKRDYGQTRSLAAVNRTLGILRHAVNWGRGRTPPIFVASPFHRFGVKIKTKGETKRDRRIALDEEGRLLDAADKLDCTEHAFAGAQMRDRIVGALETGCRLGEMLKIQNRHMLWDTHQIIIPAEHAKDAESRRIPFEPKARLAQLLKRRRFLGPKAFVFGAATGEYQGTIRTAWESLVLLAHGIEPTRTRAPAGHRLASRPQRVDAAGEHPRVGGRIWVSADEPGARCQVSTEASEAEARDNRRGGFPKAAAASRRAVSDDGEHDRRPGSANRRAVGAPVVLD